MKIKIKENLTKVFQFLKEVRLETRKIDWLSARETFKYTLVVLFVSVIIAIFLGGIDFLFTLFLNKFIL